MIYCGNCIYFKVLNLGGAGKCVRNSPTQGDLQTGGIWPVVYADESCGEYVSKVNGDFYTDEYKFEDDNE